MTKMTDRRFSYPKAFLLLAVMICFEAECLGSPAEKKLVAKLLDKYNPMVRPATHNTEVINVTFTITLQQIVDLDEKNQLLTTSMYMGWTWNDTYMKWNPEDYDGITDIRLPAKKLWKPDILIYNSAVDAFDQMLQTNLIVYSSGLVEWLPPGLFKTTCDVDIRYFPFDEQKCLIKFGAWTHHGFLVDLSIPNEKADTSSYTPSGEWDLLSIRGKRTSVTYDCCDFPFVDVTYTIHMRRRTLFYGFNLILPCVLVCSLTILVFLLPADSGERITLGITVLLALVVFLQLVADNLPPTDVIPLLDHADKGRHRIIKSLLSTYISVVMAIIVFMVSVSEVMPQNYTIEPLLCKYFACSIVMVTSSVIATVVSLNFHHTTAQNTNEMPQWISVIFMNLLPKLLRMRRPGENSCTRKFIDGPDGSTPHYGEAQPLVAMGDKLGGWKGSNPDCDDETKTLQEANRDVKKILDELTFITSRMHNDDEDEKSALEWQFAATVLDRFCVWFFLIYFVLSTAFTLGLAPGILLPYPSDRDL